MASKVRKRVNAAMRERKRQREAERNRPPNERLVRLRQVLFGGPVPESRPYATGDGTAAGGDGGGNG